MKHLYNILFFTCILQCFPLLKSDAATINWKGTNSSDWGTGSNWSSGSVPASGDDVQIGVVSFTNQPTLNSGATTTIASLTFGTTKNTTLTINSGYTLAVTGSITQSPSSGLLPGSGTLTTTLAGVGSITCASLNVGNNSTFLSVFSTNNLNVVSTITSLHISGNVAVNSTTYGVIFLGFAYNNATFSLQGGTTLVDGTILTANTNSGLLPSTFATPTFSVDMPSGSSLSPVLQLTNAAAINTSSVAGTIDLYNNTGGTGTSTVYYNGTGNQEIYTNTTTALNTSPNVYQNLIFSGSMTKTADGGNLTVANDFTLAASGSETVDLSINNPIVTIGGNLTTNSGTLLKQGSGIVTVSGNLVNGGTLTLGTANLNVGGNYNNTGTYTQSTGTTLFNGSSAQTLQDGSSSGTQFNNVSFSGAGAKTMSSGAFSVSGTGILTMIGSSTLAAGGNLTLKSTASGSATVAALPTGSGITGNVNVQRFLSGGSLSRRGYRLLSSPVNQGSRIYSINYLKNSMYLTGTNGIPGGFDKAGNPTLYLFRENLAPSNTSFISGNYRAIGDISTSPNYTIDIDGAPYNITAGNGFLCFFRGDRNSASLAAETTTTYVPTDATLTATGTLNTDTITVKNWYTPSSWRLGYTTTTGNSSIKGYNLVGNPYASSIDWDKFQTSSSTTGIYGYNVSSTIYVLDEITKTYGSYIAGSSGVGSQAFVSNIIASGQGFFVIANCSCARLTFNESAKTNTQPTGAKLLMGTPLITNINQYIRLQVMGKDSTISEQTMIRFKDQAPLTYTPDVDALYKPGFGLASLSSKSSDQVDLSINSIPLPKQKSESIKLNVNATHGGTYTLKLRDMIAVPQIYDIWLMDAYKKDSLDMRQNKIYAFDIYKNDTASFGSNRFTLVIRQNAAYAYHLLNFTVNKVPTSIRQVQVTWTAINEGNYTSFTVERSIDDGKTFGVLGGAKAAGQGTYSFIDKSPVSGANLYRLKQEDINNTIFYSKIVTIQYSDLSDQQLGNKINIYPNPVSSNLNLEIAAATSDSVIYNIRVMNSSGVEIRKITSSKPFWQGSMGNLQPGAYILQVFNNDTQSLIGESKFIKLQ